MKMIGCCPSRRIGVAVSPSTNFAFASGVVLQQGIDAHCVFASQVVIDDGIGTGDQKATTAISALDPRLLAYSGGPLVGTGWRIASSSGALAFPAHWINVGATAK